MKKFRLYIISYLYNIISLIKKNFKLINHFYNFIKKNIHTLFIIQLESLFKVNVFFILKNKKNKRSKISTITNNDNCVMTINQKFMKIKIQVHSTLLNIFHLIYKVDLLRAKVPKLRSEVVDRV